MPDAGASPRAVAPLPLGVLNLREGLPDPVKASLTLGQNYSCSGAV